MTSRTEYATIQRPFPFPPRTFSKHPGVLCDGCAGHGDHALCNALPDCMAEEPPVIYKEVIWNQK